MNGLKMFAGAGLTLAAGVTLAQPEVEWERTYGGEGSDYCTSLIQTADGGFAMAGYTRSFGAGNADFWLVRTNSDGDSLWSRTYGGNSDDICSSIIQTPDEGFTLAGYTQSFGAGGMDFWLVRTNSDGDSLWSRTFGGERSDICHSMSRTAENGFALAGGTLSFSSGGFDFWIVNVNADGDSLWSSSFGTGMPEICSSIICLEDSGFALSGYCTEFNYDFWLVRTNSDGDSLWSKSYASEEQDVCLSLIETTDRGFALAGSTGGSGGFNDQDVWLVRTDVNGDSIWSSTYGSPGSDRCISLIQANDGGFVMATRTSTVGQVGNSLGVVKTDAEGDSLWTFSFGHSCTSIIQIADGGFTIAGSSYREGSSDFYLVKTTPDPVSVRDPHPLTPYTLYLAPPYPNPFNSSTRIPFEVGVEGAGVVWLSIFNPLGRRVADLIPPQSLVSGKGSVVWNATEVPAGEYIVRLEAGDQQLSRKLSVVK